MNKIRLFVTDMDGTLLNSRTEVSRENTEALLALHRAGVMLAIASGRMADDVPETLRGAISYFIESDGGRIRELASGRTLYCETIPRKAAARYVHWLEDEGYFVYIHQDGRFLITGKNTDGRLTTFYPDVRGRGEKRECLGDAIENERLSPEKIGTLLFTPEDVGRILARREDFSEITMVQTNVMAVEAHSPRTSKGDALRWLASHLGIAADEVAVVGDSDNDISMFSWAGHAYAMANATPGARKAAGRQTASNDEDGVAQVARSFLG